MIPTVLWSQDNKGHVCLAFQIFGGKDFNYTVDENKMTFHAKDTNNVSYDVDLNLYDKVDINDHKSVVYGREVVVTLTKQNKEGGFWKQLLSDVAKPNFVKLDFKRMHDEDSDSENNFMDQFGNGMNPPFDMGDDEDAIPDEMSSSDDAEEKPCSSDNSNIEEQTPTPEA